MSKCGAARLMWTVAICSLVFWTGLADVFPDESILSESSPGSLLRQRDRLEYLTNKRERAGQLDEAITYAEGMLVIEQRVLGNAHHDTGGSQYRLAQLHLQKNDWAAARSAAEESLNIFAALGDQAVADAVDCRFILNEIDRKAKLTAQELALLKQAQRIRSEADNAFKGGDIKQATGLAVRAVELHQKLLGDDNQPYFIAVVFLGRMHARGGDDRMAERFYREVYDRVAAIAGSKHPRTLQASQILVDCLEREANGAEKIRAFDEARRVRREIVTLAGAQYGENHWQTRLARFRLADVDVQSKTNVDSQKALDELMVKTDKLYDQRATVEALASARQLVKNCRALVGSEHALTRSMLVRLANCALDAGEYEEAIGACREGRAIEEALYSLEVPVARDWLERFATDLERVASGLLEGPDLSRPRSLIAENMAIKVALFGEGHAETEAVRQTLDYLDRLASLSPDARKRILDARKLHDEVKKLVARHRADEALPVAELAVAVRKETLGEKHPEYATALVQLASVHINLNDLEEGVALARKASKILREALSPDDAKCRSTQTMLAYFLPQLAEKYTRLQNYRAAVEAQRERLQILTELYSAQDWRVKDAELDMEHSARLADLSPTDWSKLAGAARLQEMGKRQFSARRYDESAPFTEQSLKMRREVFLDRDPNGPRDLVNLGTVLQKIREYDRAELMYRDALAMRRKQVGELHPQYIDNLSALAELAIEREQFDRAAELRWEAYSISRTVFGVRDWRAIDQQLAFDHSDDVARMDEASRRRLAKAVETDRQGNSAYGRRDDAAALDLAAEVWAIRQDILGNNNVDTLKSLRNLARIDHSLFNFDRAEARYREALAGFKRVAGTIHPLYADTLQELSDLLVERGQGGKAAVLQRELVDIDQKLDAESGWRALSSALTLSRLEQEVSVERQAPRQLRRADELEQSARDQQQKGRLDAAVDSLRTVLAIRTRLLGDDDPACRKTRLSLVRCLEDVATERGRAQHPVDSERAWREIIELRKVDPGTPAWLIRQAQERAEFQKGLAKLTSDERNQWQRAGKLEQNADAVYTPRATIDPRHALEQGEQAIAILARLFGEDSLVLANASVRQADRYSHQQNFTAALARYRKAAATQKSRLGPESTDYRSSMELAAACLMQSSDEALSRNDLRTAIAAQEECLTIRKEFPGQSDPVTILTAVGLNEIKRLESLNAAERVDRQKAVDLAREGGKAFQEGRIQEALSRQREAVAIFKRVLGADSREYAGSLKDLATVYRELGDMGQAVASLNEALDVMQHALGDRHPACADVLEALCDALSNAGSAALQADDPATAQKMFETALAEREKFYPNPDDYRLVWSRLYVVVAQKFSRLDDRERKLVAQARRLAAHTDELAQSGQFDRAIETALELRAVREAVWGKDHFLVRESLLELGRLYHNSGAYDQAEPLYQEALELTRRILGSRRPEDADVLDLLGKLYADLGDRSRSNDYFQEAVSIRQQVAGENAGVRRLQDEALQAVANTLLAMVSDLGSDEAREFLDSPAHQQLVAIMEQLRKPDSPIRFDFLRIHARIQQAAGNFDSAEEMMAEAKALLRRYSGRESPEFVVEQLDLAMAQRNYPEAERLVARCTALIEDLGHSHEHPAFKRVLTQLAEVYEATGRTTKAREALVRAMKIERRVLGRAFGVEGEWGIRSYLNKAGSSRDMLISLAHRHATDDPEAASVAFSWALERKALEFDAMYRAREARALGSEKPAVASALRRLRALQQRLADLAVKPHVELTPAAQQQELQSLRAQINRTTQEADELLAGILKGPPAAGADPAALESVRARLPPRTALVEYVKASVYQVPTASDERRWLEPHYFAFVLTPDSSDAPQLVDLGPADEIEGLVIKLRDEFSDAPGDLAATSENEVEAHLRETSHALYAAIFDGIRKFLGNSQTVYLAADGELNRVPFAALASEENKYLIDDYRFAYISSGRDLLRQAAAPGRGTVVFADPNYKMNAERRHEVVRQLLPNSTRDSSSSLFSGHLSELRGMRLPRLEETMREADFIARELAESSLSPVSVFARENALEDVLKAQQSPRILHLATHGFFLDSRDWFTEESGGSSDAGGSSGMARLRGNRNPLLRSGIFLAGANAFGVEKAGDENVDDGIVMAEEVSLLDLRGTDLVVLSACESGLGDIVAGEGVFGLRRAFQYAGAKTLVTSLFKVPDLATREIMQHFYASIKSGSGKLSALHDAQVAVRRARRAANGAAHPYFWASFVLVGNPE